MVRCFLDETTPLLTFDDGLEVVKVLMACYLSAQLQRVVDLQDVNLDEFVPDVAKGTWKPQ
jgi:predicted dehydrogenase